MKLAIGAMSFGPRVQLNLDLIRHAEKLGFDSAWTAEAYGNDAVTTATWVAAKTETINVGTAIMQMPARTPAMASQPQAASAAAESPGWISKLRSARQRRKAAKASSNVHGKKGRTSTASKQVPAQQPPPQPQPENNPADADEKKASVFDQARKRARRRFKN